MREDMPDFLIHFTKGENIEDAYQNLKNIIDESVVHGSTLKIRGGSECVFFSEAPFRVLKMVY